MKELFKCPLQMSLEHWQVLDISHLTRKPVLLFDHPHDKEMFSSVQSYYVNNHYEFE